MLGTDVGRAAARLIWSQRPRTVLIVKKWNEKPATDAMESTARFLGEKGLFVLFDPNDPELPPLDSMYARAWKQSDNVASRPTWFCCVQSRSDKTCVSVWVIGRSDRGDGRRWNRAQDNPGTRRTRIACP
eukprot:916021-Rhodomonas_salina.4